MIVYHGSTEKNGKSILNDGYIDPYASGVYDNDPDPKYRTTKGFVYVSDDPLYAFYYAQKNSIFFEKSRDYAYLFKIDIAEEELLSDHDEFRIVKNMAYDDYKNFSASDSLNKCNSARIERKLLLKTDVIAYAKIPLQTNESQSATYRENLKKIVAIRKGSRLSDNLKEEFNKIFLFEYLH